MHDVTEQIKRMAMMVLLLLFGGALVSGLLASVSLTYVAIALKSLFASAVVPLSAPIHSSRLTKAFTIKSSSRL